MSHNDSSTVYIVIYHNHFDDYKNSSTENNIKLVSQSSENAYKYAVEKNIKCLYENECNEQKMKISENILEVIEELIYEIPNWKNTHYELEEIYNYILKLPNQDCFTGEVTNEWYFVEKHTIKPSIIECDEDTKEFVKKYCREIRDKYKLPESEYEKEDNEYKLKH